MVRRSAICVALCLLIQYSNGVQAAIPADIKLALASRDFETAVDWLSAHASEPDAAFELGKLFRLGKGVPKDAEQAAKLFEIAADDGNYQAQYLLGKYHDREDRIEKAVYWMQLADRSGH